MINRSEMMKKLWSNPDYRNHMKESHKGNPNPNKGRKGYIKNGQEEKRVGKL